jgi:hypothetical protein
MIEPAEALLATGLSWPRRVEVAANSRSICGRMMTGVERGARVTISERINEW